MFPLEHFNAFRLDRAVDMRLSCGNPPPAPYLLASMRLKRGTVRVKGGRRRLPLLDVPLKAKHTVLELVNARSEQGRRLLRLRRQYVRLAKPT